MGRLGEERTLKEQGEELAKAAVESGLGANQLRDLYRLLSAKPLPFWEAHVQHQIGRSIRGFSGGFGCQLLALAKKYEGEKEKLLKVLMYANMLLPYYEKRGKPAVDVGAAVEPIVRRATSRYGFERLEVQVEGGGYLVRVWLKDFSGNRKMLASSIEEALRREAPQVPGRLRVWIESSGRR